MQQAETKRIARALQRKGFPASSYDSGSNFGYGVLNYETNALYFNPWSMPPDWLAVYRKLVASETGRTSQTKEN